MTAAVKQARGRHDTTTESEGVISGAVLRGVRNMLGLSQEAMADKLFVDTNTYRSWEHGRRPLTRLPLHRYKALARGLAVVGVPVGIVETLDVAVDVDLAIGRALSSEDNPFPAASHHELWHELLAWAILGTVPEVFKGYGVTDRPRMTTVDRNTLLRRIRVAVNKPDGDLDTETLRVLGRVYLGHAPCPAWCAGRCQNTGSDLWQLARMAHTTEDINVGDLHTRMTQDGPEALPLVELNTPAGRVTFTPAESGHLGSALIQFAREGVSR